MKVYLCGPIAGKTDEQMGWRTQLTDKLEALGHQVLDPLRRDFRSMSHTDYIARAAVAGDLADLAIADVLVRWFDEHSEGSPQEMFHFYYTLHRPVVVIIPNGATVRTDSPWFIAHHTHKVASIDEAVATINQMKTRHGA